MKVLPLLSALCVLSVSLDAQVVVIVSKKNSMTRIPKDQISQIFLGQVSNFWTGGKAEPVDLPESAPARAEFYTQYLGKSAAQVKAHWSKQTLSGKGQPPTTAANPADLVKLVASNPKYIGYVNKNAADDSVTVLTLIEGK